jgi:hypothetical protein
VPCCAGHCRRKPPRVARPDASATDPHQAPHLARNRPGGRWSTLGYVSRSSGTRVNHYLPAEWLGRRTNSFALGVRQVTTLSWPGGGVDNRRPPPGIAACTATPSQLARTRSISGRLFPSASFRPLGREPSGLDERSRKSPCLLGSAVPRCPLIGREFGYCWCNSETLSIAVSRVGARGFEPPTSWSRIPRSHRGGTAKTSRFFDFGHSTVSTNSVDSAVFHAF